MLVHSLVVGPFEENTYILADEESREAVVIDPGDEAPRILEVIERHDLTVRHILLTHAHIDHILAVPAIHKATGAPVALHPAEVMIYQNVAMQASMLGMRLPKMVMPPIANPLAEGNFFSWGRLTATVRLSPGHSPGGVVFLVNDEKGTCVCGDSVFAGSIGRTDLWGADYSTLMESIRREILSLPDATPLLPGHGPATTVGIERRANPFLGDFA